MKQIYESYTPDDFEVWRKLFVRQAEFLKDKAHQSYLDCLKELSVELNADKIPDFNELNKALRSKNGWSIHTVPGLIPVVDFFELLAEKKFCSSTWLRSIEKLDYLEEPDMFHDIFGHIPLFMNMDYANFIQKIGILGSKYQHNQKVIEQLQNLYWYTIEFGLMKQGGESRIYGAGILSSYGETKHIFDEPIVTKPYDIINISNTYFDKSNIQKLYFEIDSFADLFHSLEDFENDILAVI